MPNAERREAAQVAWQAFVQSRLGNLPHGALGDRASLVEIAEFEIEAMRNSCSRALELRNATASPACRLPPETLAVVFSYLQTMWPTTLECDSSVDVKMTDKPFFFTKGWYSVAHVCRLWREAAYTPSLWCAIACVDLPPDFLPIVLTRTRGLPLILSMRCLPLGDNPSDDLDLLWRVRLVESLRVWLSVPVLRRVERLTFEDGFRQRYFAICRSFSQSPMPLLKELNILAAPPLMPDLDDHLSLRQPPFASYDYPSLRRLSLSNCDMEERSTRALLTRNITHLMISRDAGSLSHRRFDKLYESIATMHCLEELVLINSFPTELDYIEGSPDILHLPRTLRVLQISAEFNYTHEDIVDDTLRFVNRLIIPPTTYASIALVGKDMDVSDSEESEDDDPDDWLEDSLLDTSFAALFAVGDYTDDPREMTISYNAYCMYSAKSTPLPSPRDHSSTSPGGRAFCIDCFCHECPPTKLSERIERLPLHSLHSIYFQLSHWIDGSYRVWWKSFLGATSVQRVAVEWDSWSCDGLWDALSVPTPTSDVLFPALETIVIYDPSGTSDASTEFSRVAGALIDMLHTRKDRQVPVCDMFVDERIRNWAIWSLVAEVTSVTFFTPEPGAA